MSTDDIGTGEGRLTLPGSAAIHIDRFALAQVARGRRPTRTKRRASRGRRAHRGRRKRWSRAEHGRSDWRLAHPTRTARPLHGGLALAGGGLSAEPAGAWAWQACLGLPPEREASASEIRVRAGRAWPSNLISSFLRSFSSPFALSHACPFPACAHASRVCEGSDGAGRVRGL